MNLRADYSAILRIANMAAVPFDSDLSILAIKSLPVFPTPLSDG
jgi:hypothetical protein